MTRCGQCKHWKKDDDLLPGTGRCLELTKPVAVSYPATPLPVQVLGFTLEEIREARLAPIVSFKGRGATPAADTDLNNTAAEYGKAGE